MSAEVDRVNVTPINAESDGPLQAREPKTLLFGLVKHSAIMSDFGGIPISRVWLLHADVPLAAFFPADKLKP